MASKKSRRRRSDPEVKKLPLEKKEVKIGIFILAIIVIVAIAAAILMSGGNDNDDQNGVTPVGNPIAVIDTSMGVIKVELYKDKVPNTVDNFVNLANDGFYDGLVFHRVIDDFMIQGGGFEVDGAQKVSPYGTIDLEINEEVRHVDGAIAMARTNDPNSATSQFYICDGAQSGLDDQYAAFGGTIEGMDVVISIASVDTTSKNGMSDWPEDDVIIKSITIENQ